MGRGGADDSSLIEIGEGDRVRAYGATTGTSSPRVTPSVNTPSTGNAWTFVVVAAVCALALSVTFMMRASGNLGTVDDGDGPYTLVAACKLTKERRPMFVQALKSWLELPVDTVHRFVIVDWSSEEDLEGIARELTSRNLGGVPRRVDVVKLAGDVDWKLPAAYNVGMFGVPGSAAIRPVATEFFLKVDCDTHLDSAFLAANDLRARPSNVFRTPDASFARDRNDWHINGVIVGRTNEYKKINGYDERLVKYGYDDDDLYDRLMKVGNVREEVTRVDAATGRSLINHIKHPVVDRGNNPPHSCCLNRVGIGVAAKTAPWAKQTRTAFEELGERAVNEVVRPGMSYASKRVAVKTPVVDVERFLGPGQWRWVKHECGLS